MIKVFVAIQTVQIPKLIRKEIVKTHDTSKRLTNTSGNNIQNSTLTNELVLEEVSRLVEAQPSNKVILLQGSPNNLALLSDVGTRPSVAYADDDEINRNTVNKTSFVDTF